MATAKANTTRSSASLVDLATMAGHGDPEKATLEEVMALVKGMKEATAAAAAAAVSASRGTPRVRPNGQITLAGTGTHFWVDDLLGLRLAVAVDGPVETMLRKLAAAAGLEAPEEGADPATLAEVIDAILASDNQSLKLRDDGVGVKTAKRKARKAKLKADKEAADAEDAKAKATAKK